MKCEKELSASLPTFLKDAVFWLKHGKKLPNIAQVLAVADVRRQMELQIWCLRPFGGCINDLIFLKLQDSL